MIDLVLIALVVQADVIVVSAQIVEFIDIKAIALVCNDLEHPQLLVIRIMLAFDEPADQLRINFISFGSILT